MQEASPTVICDLPRTVAVRDASYKVSQRETLIRPGGHRNETGGTISRKILRLSRHSAGDVGLKATFALAARGFAFWHALSPTDG